jgi:copper ion binding protein
VKAVERTLGGVPGVQSVSVNFAAETATVTYERDRAVLGAMIDRVREAGYSVVLEHRSFPVRGISCPSCVDKIEKTLRGLPGVVEASVNFGTGEARVSYLPGESDSQAMGAALRPLGYEMALADTAEDTLDREERLRRSASQALKRRWLMGILFSLPIVVLHHWNMIGLNHLIDIPRRGSAYLQWLFCTPVQFYVGLAGRPARHDQYEHPDRCGDVGGLPLFGGCHLHARFV